MRCFFNTTLYVKHSIFFYCNDRYNKTFYFALTHYTVCSSIQVSVKKKLTCHFSLKYKWCPNVRQYVFHDVTYSFTLFLHTKQSSLPHSLHAPNGSTSHIEPIFRHACHARKALCRISTLHLHRLCHQQSHHFQIQFPYLIQQMILVRLLCASLFQVAILLLAYLTATRLSSLDIPATASSKEKLLVALHNSLLIVLLDLWEQNILLLHEE